MKLHHRLNREEYEVKRSLYWLSGTLFVGLFVSVAAQAKPNSHVVRTYLAGARLEETSNFIKFDTKERYYLSLQKDGLGHLMVISLKLCPDRKQMDFTEDGPADSEISKSSLPRLKTGAGINIGDTPAQVVKKIGEQPQELTYNRKTETRIFVYKAPISLKVEGKTVKWEYQGIYTFRNEQLWAIEYEAREPDNADY